jgi:nucleotide-binding universal stress UspA family protein
VPPLRKIAVGFDGSVDARAAAYWALALAQQVDCEVVVVHAVGLLEHGARQPQADGSRGQGAHAGHLLGSTSHELAEHARVPLVIVPTPEDTSARTDLT